MANNTAVSVTADAAGLQAAMNLAKVSMQDFGKEARAVARDIKAGDTTQETATKFLRLSEAEVKATAELALYRREVQRAQAANTAANDNAGQLRAGFQNLGFQLQDISVQFASGQRAGTIFAQQLPQVAGALTQIAQAGGNTTGVMGRFATFMSGPWGVAVGVAAAVLPALIAKLFETGDAAASAKAEVYDLAKAMAEMGSKPMEALGKLNSNVLTAQGKVNAANAMPGGTRGQLIERAMALRAAEDELAKAKSELEAGKVSAENYQRMNAARAGARAGASGSAGSSGSTSRSGRAGDAARQAREQAQAEAKAAQEELQERIAVNAQEDTLAEDRANTDIALSRIALQAKLADIATEQRAGTLSGAQAVQAKAKVNAELMQLDQELENRLFAAKLKELQANRSNYAVGTKDYAAYTRQIEVLEAQHNNRMAILNAQARAKDKQLDLRLESERDRRMKSISASWAGELARMATLQQSFGATVTGIWQSVQGAVAIVIQQMLADWIAAHIFKIGATKTEAVTTATAQAALAGAGGVASMAAAPFPINLGAPAFGAAMFATSAAYGSLASFAAGTNQLPNDMIAQVHAGERIVPKADNQALLELTRRGAGLDRPGAQSGGGTVVNLNIQALDGQSVRQFFMSHQDKLAAAVAKAVRNGFRGER